MTVTARPPLSAPIAMTAAGKDTAPARLSLAVVLYLAMILIPIQFNLGTIFMTGVRTVLLVMIVPLTLRLFTGGLGRILLTDVLLLVYGLWNIFTLFLNSPSQAISFGGSYVLEVYGSYLLARAFVRTPEQFHAACRGLFIVLLCSLPFAFYETQTGRAPLNIWVSKLPGIHGFHDFYNAAAGRRLGLERSQVMFAHPIHYGVFCASLFSLAFVGFRDRIGTLRRYLLCGAVCAGVVFSVSSGAILPMFFQAGLIGWAWAMGRVKSRWIILTVLVVLAYVGIDLLSNRTPIVVLLEHVALSPETAYGRVIIFEWGMINVWKHPFFGLGLNDWERPWFKLSPSMDNFWLLVAVRYGIPGFLMLAVAYLAVVWGAMRRDLGPAADVLNYRRAWVFGQIALILALCTVDVWSTALSFVFFLFGMGVWFLQYRPPERREAVPAAPHSDFPRALSGQLSYTRFAGRSGRGPDRIARPQPAAREAPRTR